MTSEPEILLPAEADKPKPFTPGNSGWPAGKPPGPNKMTRLLKDAIVAAAELAGDRLMHKEIDTLIETYGEAIPPDLLEASQSTRGLTKYLLWVAENEPKSFVSLLGRITPLQLAGEFTVAPTNQLATLMAQINGKTRSK